MWSLLFQARSAHYVLSDFFNDKKTNLCFHPIRISLKFRDSLELHFIYWSSPLVRTTYVQLNGKLCEPGCFKTISTLCFHARNKCYHELSKLLKARMTSRNLKVRLYRSYTFIIQPVVMHECETWTLLKSKWKNFFIFEKKILRRSFGSYRQ